MVAGCCQTWIEHPIQSDRARPRSDLHPHFFATKAHWRARAYGLAALPRVLSVAATGRLIGDESPVPTLSLGVLAIAQMDCSNKFYSSSIAPNFQSSVPCHPAIGNSSTSVGWNEHGSWTSSIIVRWRSFFLENGWTWVASKLYFSKFQSSSNKKIASYRVLGAKDGLRKFAVKNGSPQRVRLQNSNLNPPPCPQNWNNKSQSKHHSKWLQKLGLSALCHNLSQAAATTTSISSMLQVAQNQQCL